MNDDYMDDDSETADGEIRVPYRDRGGVKTVSCLINGTLREDMIFDSGCSGTLISSAEATYMLQKGILTMDDCLGTTSSTIADGSTMESWVFVIKSLVIGDQLECTNVVVTVADNPGAPLLLGNEVLDRFPGYTIDNARHEIVFHLQ